MSDQHPGVEDEVERALRLGLATASQMADRYARVRQDLARQAQHRSDQEARQLEARYRAEGASAAARLAVVDRTEWWDRATPADITSMWQLATQWQDEQPQAAVAGETIARQVQDRYGIDVRAPGVNAEALRAPVVRLDAEQRSRASQTQNHADTATAVAAVVRAEQRDAALVPPAAEELEALAADARARAVQHHAEVAAPVTHPVPESHSTYDSVERREQTAGRLRESGHSPEVIAVAMRADVAQARPAAESATTNPAGGPGSRGGVPTRAQLRDRSR